MSLVVDGNIFDIATNECCVYLSCCTTMVAALRFKDTLYWLDYLKKSPHVSGSSVMRAVLQVVSSRGASQVLLDDHSCIEVQDESISLALCNKLCNKPTFYESFGFVNMSSDKKKVKQFNLLAHQLADMPVCDVTKQLQLSGLAHLRKIARQASIKAKLLQKQSFGSCVSFGQLVQALVKSSQRDQLLLARLLSAEPHDSEFSRLLEQLDDTYSPSMVKYLTNA